MLKFETSNGENCAFEHPFPDKPLLRHVNVRCIYVDANVLDLRKKNTFQNVLRDEGCAGCVTMCWGVSSCVKWPDEHWCWLCLHPKVTSGEMTS